MQISLVSTSRIAARNLGDQLIADRCKAMVAAVAPSARITTLFRHDAWANVARTIAASDMVVIACLAIRKDMTRAYGFLDELIGTDVPVAVVSAGLSVSSFSSTAPLAQQLNDSDIGLLSRLADRSVFFSSRGILTQALLAQLGIASTFAGDVAFYQPDFGGRRFQSPDRIDRIAVSDPHYTPEYRYNFLHLVRTLREIFPGARIDLLIHGHNDEVIPIAAEAGIEAIEMYRHRGLSHYDDYDLHVGYRIHGHVSALSRRIPSYLLEQDDRGIDYGSTFSRRISVACYRNMSRRSADGTKQVLTAPVEVLGAMLRQDRDQGFTRFSGLEPEIEASAQRNLDGLAAAVRTLPKAPVSASPRLRDRLKTLWRSAGN
jgi:hypothetical protein